MSKEKFDLNCPGCRPAIVDIQTGQVLPADHPAMMKANKVFNEASILEKQAWHAVTCLNSRSPLDLALCRQMTSRLT